MTWKERQQAWWEENARQTSISFGIETEMDITRPFPYLSAKSQYPHSQNWKLKRNHEATFAVTNLGNLPALAAHIGIYERANQSNAQFIKRGQIITSISPYATSTVTFNFTPLILDSRIIGMCFDPILDPLEGFFVGRQLIRLGVTTKE